MVNALDKVDNSAIRFIPVAYAPSGWWSTRVEAASVPAPRLRVVAQRGVHMLEIGLSVQSTEVVV